MGVLTAKDFWNPNTHYYSDGRYKHLIEHNGSLYVCAESHVSGSTFDSSKFTAISGSGGGGLTVGGEWDIETAISLGPITELPLGFDTTYDSNLLSPLYVLGNTSGTPAYPYDETYRIFGASSPVITKTSGTKWITIDTSPSIVYSFVMVYEDTYIDPINDLIIPSLDSSPNSQSNYASIVLIKIPSNNANGISVITNTLQEAFSGVTMTEVTASVEVGFDLLAGTMSVRIGADTDVKNITITGTNLKVGVFSLYGSFFTNADIAITNGTPEFTYSGQPNIVVPPENAVDGELYFVTSEGVYNNTPLSYGDYAAFYDNTTSVVPIKNYDSEILSLTNTIDALNTFVTNSTPSLLEYVSTRGIIDFIGATEPGSPVYGKTWIDTANEAVLKAYDDTAWVTVAPMQFQKFLYADTGLELYYNKLQIATRRGSGVPLVESNSEYYDLLANSYNRWSVSEDKSCQYIALTSNSSETIYLNNYTHTIIDASDATLTDYTVWIDGVVVYDTETAYVKEHTIQLISDLNSAKINFHHTDIVGLNSSTVEVSQANSVILKVYETDAFVHVHYVSGCPKIINHPLSGISNNYFVGNVEEIFLTVNLDTSFNLTSRIRPTSTPKKFVINYKNTVAAPDLTLTISNDIGNPDLVIPISIVGVSGKVTIITDGNTYEVF